LWGSDVAPVLWGGASARHNFGGSALLMAKPFDVQNPNRRCITYGNGHVLGVSNAIAYCTNALRGLSAIAEFPVMDRCIMSEI